VLSIVFLISYILHHLLAGDTNSAAWAPSGIFILSFLSPIFFLAAVILPFILFTAYGH